MTRIGGRSDFPARATHLCKVGRSVMLAVPPALLDVLHLTAGARVAPAVDKGRLVIEPCNRLRYTLDELLAQCDPSAELSQQEREWLDALDAPAVGREVI